MEQLQKYMTVISKILETCLDESWTHHFQLGLTKVFKF